MNMRQIRLTRRLCGVAMSPRRIGLVGSSQQARVQYAAAASNAAATEPQTFTITTPLYYVNAGAGGDIILGPPACMEGLLRHKGGLRFVPAGSLRPLSPVPSSCSCAEPTKVCMPCMPSQILHACMTPAAPHMGSAYPTIAADVVARFQVGGGRARARMVRVGNAVARFQVGGSRGQGGNAAGRGAIGLF